MDASESESSEDSTESTINTKSFKKTKSRVTSKRNKNTSSKSTSISSNSNKRKLNQYNCNNDTKDNDKPNRKKRKFNQNNIHNELNTLLQSNQSLKIQNDELMKERDEYLQGINILKQEAKKWKTKYLKLYSKISEITKVEAKELKTHNNSNIVMNNSNSKFTNSNTSVITKNNGTKHKLSKKKHKNGSNKNKNINNIKMKHVSKSVLNSDIIQQKCQKIETSNNKINIIDNKTHKLIKRTDEMNKKNISNDKNINNEIDTKYDEIKNQLFEMGFDKTQVINKISLYNNSTESPKFVFNELINTLTADTQNVCRQLRSYTQKKKKNSKKFKKRKRPNFNNKKILDIHNTNDSDFSSNYYSENNNDGTVEYIEFEKSYYVSVNCHICNCHFSDIFEYKNHLEEHYNNDINKTWLKCEWGCNIKPNDGMKFIRHIGTHTNDKPYHCNVKVNGIKCDATMGYTRYLKNHWKSHFDIYIQSSDDCQHTQSDTQSETEIDIQNNNNNNNNINIEKDISEYEKCYYISVNCHICSKHFDDFDKYKDHLENHFNKDPDKKWRQCDQCNINQTKLWINNVRFIGHIATHTKDKPFKCNMLIDEKDKKMKCPASFSRKTDFKQHWQKHHKNIELKNENKNEIKQVKIKINQTKYLKKKYNYNDKGLKNNYLFEDSYFVSVNCHLCKELFESFSEYRDHIRMHYDNDPLRQWLQCDFGCLIDPNKPLFSGAPGFLNHIASHTKNYPFKCIKPIIGNGKCKNGLGIKSDLKRHWIVYHKNIKKNEIESNSESDKINNSNNHTRNRDKKKYKNKKNVKNKKNTHYKNGYDRK